MAREAPLPGGLIPHMGNALEPARSLDPVSGLVTAVPQPNLHPRTAPTGTEFDPGAADFGNPLPASISNADSPSMLQSPPPEHPESAADMAMLQETVGRLINSIGDQNRQHRLDMLEQETNFNLRLAQVGQQAPAPNRGGADPTAMLYEDPDKPMTRAEMAQLFQQVGQHQQVMAAQQHIQQLRANSTMTPTQEYEILARYPALQQMPEPQKTQTTLRYAEVLFPSTGGKGGSPSAEAPAPTTRKVLPHREQAPLPTAPDLAPGNDAAAQATAEYQRALKIPNLAERSRALRQAAEKVMRLNGTSLEEQSKVGFVHRT